MPLINNLIDFLQDRAVLLDGVQAVLVIALTLVAAKILHWVNRWITAHFVKKSKTELDDQIFSLLDETAGRLIWIAGLYLCIDVLDSLFPPGSGIREIVLGGLYIVSVLMIAHLISSVLQIMLDWYSEKWSRQNAAPLKDEFRPLIRRLIMIVIYTTAVVTILKHLNQDISSILVSLGIGSLAFALAAKDTMANMIAGFMIMTDRPFRLGDRILLESGEKGDVFDIGLRTTKILTFDNTLIVVPNQQIINEKVTNLSYPDPQIRVSVEVGVAYGSDLDRVKAILLSICDSHPDVLTDPEPSIYFINFGASSLDLKVVCRVAQWNDQWRVGEELRMQIYRQFMQENIEIPFPQRVVTIVKS